MLGRVRVIIFFCVCVRVGMIFLFSDFCVFGVEFCEISCVRLVGCGGGGGWFDCSELCWF